MTDTYPNAAGWREPTTSREAGRKIKTQALQRIVLEQIAASPMTADEVAAKLETSILTIRPRVAELRALNKITPTGERRKNASGASAMVWTIKQEESP